MWVHISQQENRQMLLFTITGEDVYQQMVATRKLFKTATSTRPLNNVLSDKLRGMINAKVWQGNPDRIANHLIDWLKEVQMVSVDREFYVNPRSV